MIYSDNGGTFVKTNKWLGQLHKDECLQDQLNEYEINWKFKLGHNLWWGGQLERLIGVVEATTYNVVGGGVLTWKVLGGVLLNVETD